MALFGRRKAGADFEGMKWGAVVVVVSAGLCVATGALIGLGYVATREWSRGNALLSERHQTEALATVSAALNRDMRGAWTTVIAPINPLAIEEEPPYDLFQLTARAFARFPYPESFIVWKDNGRADGLTYSFNRTDRRPPWDDRNPSDDPFPVTLIRNPAALRQVVADIRRQAASGNSFVLLETSIADVPYQVVAHLMFASTKPHGLSGLAAFVVNLQWMRQEYFGPLLAEVLRISGNEETLSLAVIDDRGGIVAATGPPPAVATDRKRPFPVSFLDSALVSSLPPRRVAVREWTVHVWPRPARTPMVTLQGARGVFLLITLAAGVSMLALLLTIRAIRASTILASMKSDFVSGVTHELKTPLALIRLVGDTLAQGRYASTETILEYAGLLSQAASRLSQSIDNLLTYARYSDPDTQAPIELAPTNVDDLVDGALESFMPTLDQLGFQLEVDVPRELPQVSADRPAMIQAIENVIDNAIKYSETARVLRIVARPSGTYVRVTFADRGHGIPREDIARVCDRFYRGRNSKASGSGLGLAIARRVLHCHGGKIRIRSTLNVGTEVDLLLVAAQRS